MNRLLVYVFGAISGLFLFYLSYILSNFLQLGELSITIPDAEFAFLNFIAYLTVLPLYVIFGISISHVFIHKRLGKLFLISTLLLIPAVLYMFQVGFAAIKEDQAEIKRVNIFLEQLQIDCDENGYFANYEKIETDQHEDSGAARCISDSERRCSNLNIGYTLTGKRSNAPGDLTDKDGPAYGYEYNMNLICDQENIYGL